MAEVSAHSIPEKPRRSTAHLGSTRCMHRCPSMSGPRRNELNLVAIILCSSGLCMHTCAAKIVPRNMACPHTTAKPTFGRGDCWDHGPSPSPVAAHQDGVFLIGGVTRGIF